MKNILQIFLLLVLFISFYSVSFSQAENVPAYHPVYPFLKRMELKGVIQRYRDAILPLSRREVVEFLLKTREKENELTAVEQDILRDFFVEFHYDIAKTTDDFYSFLHFPDTSLGSTIYSLFSEKEKFLYAYRDTNVSFFVDGLLTLDARRSTGDALGGANAEFAQFGGRIRGTVYDRLGYYIQGTNAQFHGSRDVLLRDKFLSQSHTLKNVFDTQSFDFVDGYVRYDANILSLQVGRERLLWGNGYGDKMVISDSIRVFDFVRADVQYKSLKYTFLHGWLLGKTSNLIFSLPSDTSAKFIEPVVADKYLVAHRLEFSFPTLFDLGFQEFLIYSNRSADLTYLNPLTLLESAQRARGERDNNFWAFDVQTHFFKNIELQGTILFDDIHFSEWWTNSWLNRDAYQLGVLVTDPVGVANSTFAVEYTRVEPFTFSHGRSRDDDYGSLGTILSHHIGPNADSWFFRLDYLFSHKLSASVHCEIVRKGKNVYDNLGNLIQNVGGDFLQPHRESDPEQKDFLGGDFVQTLYAQVYLTYEIVNQVFFDAHYQYIRESNERFHSITMNHDFGVALRFDY